MRVMHNNIFSTMEGQIKMYDYLIVGCGLYGSIIAHFAKRSGKKVIIVDKRNHIGGNVYTEKIDNINIHKYGAHIFHTSDEEVYNFVSNNCELQNFINSPIANYKGEIYNLPFNMNTFTRLFNVFTPDEAKRIIDKETSIYKDIVPTNFEEQAIKLVGETIFNKLIKGYTMKQWGCKNLCELPADIIKRVPIRYTYNNNYFNDKYQAIPKNGYTEFIKHLISGIDILLETDYFNMNKIDAKKIIYTGKIDEFFGYKYGKLEYRSLRFDERILETDNYQGNAVVNYTDYDIPYTRTIEHKHFLNDKSDKTIVTYEYPDDYAEGKEAYYPINNEKNAKLYMRYKELADKLPNISFGGRLGTYSYLDMDKVIKQAIEYAKKEGIYIER